MDTRATPYLDKAKRLFRVVMYAFVVSFLVVFLGHDVRGGFKDTLVAIPLLISIACTPLGLYYNLKSFRAKEPFRRQKLLYLSGFVFFMILFMGMLAVAIVDIKQLL